MPDMNSTLWTDDRFSTFGEQVGKIVTDTLKSYPAVYTAAEEEIMKGLGKSGVLWRETSCSRRF